MKRIAVIHDWLYVFGGAERVLEQILRCYPEAEIFSLIDFLPQQWRSHLLNKKVTTSLLQHMPFACRKHFLYLPLMPFLIERFNLTDFDLVISSSNAVAKGVLTHGEQLHVCYLQARNMKYAYEERFSYPHSRIVGLLEDYFLSKLRTWDFVASHRPDITIANSKYVSAWHERRHGIHSDVIYPPVDVQLFEKEFRREKSEYYVTACRLEPYKRLDLIVEVFNDLKKQLYVVGMGTQYGKLRRMARENITFVGFKENTEVARILAAAKAFICSAREDFGIAPLEAQACGTPVIAFGKGGLAETVRGLDNPEPTGVVFYEQTKASLKEAIERFEQIGRRLITPEACRKNALRYCSERFCREFKAYIEKSWQRFKAQGEAFE